MAHEMQKWVLRDMSSYDVQNIHFDGWLTLQHRLFIPCWKTIQHVSKIIWDGQSFNMVKVFNIFQNQSVQLPTLFLFKYCSFLWIDSDDSGFMKKYGASDQPPVT